MNYWDTTPELDEWLREHHNPNWKVKRVPRKYKKRFSK